MPSTNASQAANGATATTGSAYGGPAPTVAAFSPSSPADFSASKQMSTVIVRKKSPLLAATPPQITRALAHSHPFLLPLNHLAGLVTWTSKDPWESYLLVAAFWAAVLYGDFLLRFFTPLLGVAVLVLVLYSRRFSPLSSGTKNADGSAKSSSSSRLSLDEILDNLTLFTARCDILLGPWISLTDFLRTQSTPTVATTRPGLVTLLIRLLLISPLWIALALPPFHFLTTRRTLLFFGTTFLTWHSRPARVTRVLLWRSVFLRQVAGFITGFDFTSQTKTGSVLGTDLSQSHPHLGASALVKAVSSQPASRGVRFTFSLYENQRRWIGLGWTTSMFSYERAPWTDEHRNAAPSKENFQLPVVEGAAAEWRWIPGSEWRLEPDATLARSRTASSKGSSKSKRSDSSDDGGGWTYYDSRWGDPKPADGWNRYTRRRKWFRDAELVQIPIKDSSSSPAATADAASPTKFDDKVPSPSSPGSEAKAVSPSTTAADSPPTELNSSSSSSNLKSSTRLAGLLRRGRGRGRSEAKSPPASTSQTSAVSPSSRDNPQDDFREKWRADNEDRHRAFSTQEDVQMGLG